MIPEKAPLIPGLDIAAAYIPCFDVGGDLYGFLQLDQGSIAVMIADVMGKGIPAAIMMSSFRGAVQAYIETVRDIPAYYGNKDTKDCNKDIINRINKMACDECRNGEFITLFHAAIDVSDMTITYCNCGHEPTVLIREGEIIELEKGGLVLGVDAQAEYEIETLELKDGDSLLFYTDGLIDAVNFDGELWGRENLLETAKKFTAGSAEQMIKNILRYRRRFVGLARQVDDTSIVVVRVGK
jgi:sigma-B regulation protein RsbU (phosphoserine phosphatase)